jgi:PPK2 family polyphosphate:nucleotide phosphotransferase
MDIKDLRSELLVKPDNRFKLSKVDPDFDGGFQDDETVAALLAKNHQRLSQLQELLYAQDRHALLIVLQAMDAAGKDGTIRHVMSGINPLGCTVTSFKAPSAEERDHDFLWRVHQAVPARGEIGIFNRSHYEDVLVVRVHDFVPEAVWSKRYKQINQFERLLSRNDVTIVKFFLHISRDEQKQRLMDRLADPGKTWKFNPDDLKERPLWDKYMEAFQEALRRCSTVCAPWYAIPANKKWFRNLAISQILVETLQDLKMKYPKPAFDPKKIVIA